MVTVTYGGCHIKAPYADCRYAKCYYAECRVATVCTVFMNLTRRRRPTGECRRHTKSSRRKEPSGSLPITSIERFGNLLR
jgi:hypothetical protein